MRKEVGLVILVVVFTLVSFVVVAGECETRCASTYEAWSKELSACYAGCGSTTEPEPTSEPASEPTPQVRCPPGATYYGESGCMCNSGYAAKWVDGVLVACEEVSGARCYQMCLFNLPLDYQGSGKAKCGAECGYDPDDGSSCPSGQYVSAGKCCPQGTSNDKGVCCPEDEHNSDGICCKEGSENDGRGTCVRVASEEEIKEVTWITNKDVLAYDGKDVIAIIAIVYNQSDMPYVGKDVWLRVDSLSRELANARIGINSRSEQKAGHTTTEGHAGFAVTFIDRFAGTDFPENAKMKAYLNGFPDSSVTFRIDPPGPKITSIKPTGNPLQWHGTWGELTITVDSPRPIKQYEVWSSFGVFRSKGIESPGKMTIPSKDLVQKVAWQPPIIGKELALEMNDKWKGIILKAAAKAAGNLAKNCANYYRERLGLAGQAFIPQGDLFKWGTDAVGDWMAGKSSDTEAARKAASLMLGGTLMHSTDLKAMGLGVTPIGVDPSKYTVKGDNCFTGTTGGTGPRWGKVADDLKDKGLGTAATRIAKTGTDAVKLYGTANSAGLATAQQMQGMVDSREMGELIVRSTLVVFEGRQLYEGGWNFVNDNLYGINQLSGVKKAFDAVKDVPLDLAQQELKDWAKVFEAARAKMNRQTFYVFVKVTDVDGRYDVSGIPIEVEGYAATITQWRGSALTSGVEKK